MLEEQSNDKAGKESDSDDEEKFGMAGDRAKHNTLSSDNDSVLEEDSDDTDDDVMYSRVEHSLRHSQEARAHFTAKLSGMHTRVKQAWKVRE